MNYLLDTCFISELIKPRPQQSVIEWLGDQDEYTLFVSVLTLGEIQKGIAKLSAGKKKKQLQLWLDQDVRPRFSGRILDVTEEVAALWGKLQATIERKGRKFAAVDSLIAATALIHNLTLVTRNVADFEDSGANILNPWS